MPTLVVYTTLSSLLYFWKQKKPLYGGFLGSAAGKAPRPRYSPASQEAGIQVKQAGRPDFVTAPSLAGWRYDSHSSRRQITRALKLSTRTLREQHHRVPI